jgi:hypothetical protein
MKTSKIITYITGAVFSCILFGSCSDSFLELSPLSNANELNYYKTEKDFETAVVAAYATLHTEFSPEGGVSFCGEVMSDEATLGNMMLMDSPVSNTEYHAFRDYNIESGNLIVQKIWEEEYNSLMIVNAVLDKLNESSIDGQVKTGYEAEMRFLRALYHFNLVRMFGDIPISGKKIVAGESYDILRSPTAEVFDFIIEDLTFAAGSLPVRVSQPGRAAKGAANGLLGKVYLTMGNKADAAAALKQVIDSKEYSLLDNYADLWDLKHENSAEALFEIQYVAGPTNPSSPYNEYFGPYENFSISGQGRGMNQVAETLWNEYEDSDPRREASVFTGYTNPAGTWIEGKFSRKWYDPSYVLDHNNMYFENNFIVLRYADVLLMYAEATDDPSYLNMVRDRAHLPRYGEAAYPSGKYATLAAAIEHERMVELALEFHRWFDLKRTGRATTVLSVAKGKSITEQKLVLPIPLNERQINPALTQNPGY